MSRVWVSTHSPVATCTHHNKKVGKHGCFTNFLGLHFWDVNKQQVQLKVAIPDKNAPMEGISFNYNANQVLASSKDKKVVTSASFYM